MDLRSDERGQPVVIGALLVFAILVLAFAGYQAHVVPQQNAGVEFQHSQQVEDDMVDLRVAIVEGAIGEGDKSTSVQLGTQYPTRLIALNPAPPAGTLRTTSAEKIEITGQIGSSLQREVVDLCDGPGTTREIIYEPSYNEFQNGPQVVYENSIAYSKFPNDDTELVKTNQLLVDSDARVIRLIALEGELSETGSNRVAIDFIQGQTEEQVVRNANITLPTRVVNEETWDQEVLGEESEVVSFEPGESVTFSVEEEYEIRCTRVGINKAPGSGSSEGSGGSSEQADLVEHVPNSVSVSNKNSPRFEINIADDQVTVEAAAIETQNGFKDIRSDGSSEFRIDNKKSTESTNMSRDFNYKYDPGLPLDSGDGDIPVEYNSLETDIDNLSFVDSEGDADLIIALRFGDGSIKEFYFEGDNV